MELLIEAHQLTKSYADHVVIKDTDVFVKSGQSLAFTAPSGAGKSTMLSMLGLLLSPSAGTLAICGRQTQDLDDVSLSALRRDKIGFMFQNTQLVGSLSAIENIIAAVNFIPAKERGDVDYINRADELLEHFGMNKWRDFYPHQLSVGQKRRVACARALLLDPDIVIADEPTNDLDDESKTQVIDALFSITQKGHALICATHDLQLATKTDVQMHLENKVFVV